MNTEPISAYRLVLLVCLFVLRCLRRLCSGVNGVCTVLRHQERFVFSPFPVFKRSVVGVHQHRAVYIARIDYIFQHQTKDNFGKLPMFPKLCHVIISILDLRTHRLRPPLVPHRIVSVVYPGSRCHTPAFPSSCWNGAPRAVGIHNACRWDRCKNHTFGQSAWLFS